MAALTDEQVKEAFLLFDVDNLSGLDIFECQLAMKCLGFGDISKDEIEKLFRANDVTGLCPYDAFYKITTLKMSQKDSPDEIFKAFQLFDLDNRGKLSLANLREIARQLSESLTDEDLIDIISEADDDRDGELSFEEFKFVMLQMRGR